MIINDLIRWAAKSRPSSSIELKLIRNIIKSPEEQARLYRWWRGVVKNEN